MNDEVIQTPFGKFLVNDQDLIESTLKAGTLWDGPGFLQVIAKEHGRFGERGTTILDLGANVGSFSIYCASQGAWRVIAVEPVPKTMQRLKANLDLNKVFCADVVIPIQLAAYHEDQLLILDRYDDRNAGGSTLIKIPDHAIAQAPIRAEALDHYSYLFGDRVSLIKVDCQGCDGAAIVGLATTIQAHHPAIVFEWEPDLAQHHYPKWGVLMQALKEEGYTVQPWPSQPDNYLATVAQ